MEFRIKISILLMMLSLKAMSQFSLDLHKIFSYDSTLVKQNYRNISKEIMGDAQNFFYYYKDTNNNRVGVEKLVSQEFIQIGTWTKNIDTIIFDSSVCIFVNPFPHVFLHRVYLPPNENGIKATGYGGYSYEEDTLGHKFSCMYNDTNGTFVCYWYKNLLIKQGYFWENQKNGRWKYWNDGLLYKEEEWYRGTLKDSVVHRLPSSSTNK